MRYIVCVAILIVAGFSFAGVSSYWYSSSIAAKSSKNSGGLPLTVQRPHTLVERCSPSPIRLDSQTSPGIVDFVSSILLKGSQSVDSVEIKMLAWAISVEPHRGRPLHYIPDLYDEVLLHVIQNSRDSRKEWLFSLRQVRGAEVRKHSVFNDRWEPNGDNWRTQVVGSLDDDELHTFLNDSSFGTLNFHEIETILVRTYGKFLDKTIVLLENGLTRELRERRHDDWMRRRASPAIPPDSNW